MSCLARRGSEAAAARAGLLGLSFLATLVLLATAPVGAARPRSAPRVVVKPVQALAVLLAAHRVFSTASRDSTGVATVLMRRSLTGQRTMLPILGEITGKDGRRWLHVRLPGRPNGHTGWIEQHGTSTATTAWHLLVETSRRRLIVYRDGRPVRTLEAVVGKPSTPTPHGEFFIEEGVQLRAADPGAPFALALSARSDVLQEFDGGPGQIALHGLAHLRGVLGSAASHGCIRLDGAMMRWLVARVGPGTPVTITS